ncbi:MAG: SDR family NAD(P)-dependent oxidoreductase, partial [Actinocatenispora sp.]
GAGAGAGAGAGVERLVLVSRRGINAPGAAELKAELAQSGVAVEVVACDVSDRVQVSALVEGLSADGGLDAVVHAAGVLDDGVIDGLDAGRIAAVVAAKAGSAAVLDEVTRDLGLSAFVVFSSLAGTVGAAGQGAYAAANAMVDALVARRRARGLVGTSVAWGPWAQGGMADSELVSGRQRRGGVLALDPGLAVRALARAVGGDEPVVTVADIDWARFGPVLASAGRHGLVEQIPEARTGTESGAPATAGTSGAVLPELVAAAAPVERRDVVLDVVRARAAEVLGHGRVAEVPADRAFRDLGFDSLTALEFRNALGAAAGLSLPATVVFDYPTPEALADHLLTQLAGPQDGQLQVLAELDKIDATISEISLDADGASALKARLQVMLSRLGELGGREVESGAAKQLESATDDEIFEFIHKELGRSDLA